MILGVYVKIKSVMQKLTMNHITIAISVNIITAKDVPEEKTQQVTEVNKTPVNH